MRDFEGEHNEDFSGVCSDTDVTLEVCFDFKLLKQAPMVLSIELRSIGGKSSTYRFA